MLILGFFLVPMILAAPTELALKHYVPRSAGRAVVLKIIEVIGKPPDTLNLSGLGIRGLDVNVFENFTHAKSINLANNSIYSYYLPQSLFSRLGELEHLSLANNHIHTWRHGMFAGLNNLKLLDISNNPIGPLDRGSLYGLGKSTNISARASGYGLSILHTLAFDNFNGSESKRRSKRCYGSMRIDRDDNNLAIICIRDGIVEKLESFENRGVAKDHCRVVHVDRIWDIEDTGHHLDLKNLGISKFTAGWYRLKVNSFRGLDLNDNNITDVTAELLNDLPANIVDINLSNNKIVRLNKETIINDHIRYLNLTGNSISEIEDGALENTKLLSVDFSKNQLNNTRFVMTLPPTMHSLILKENCINEILSHVFSRFRGLEKIDFSDNNITVIQNESLHGLISAKNLILSRNQIKNIEIGAFQNLISLRFLHLANNNLISLEKGVFKGLQFMEQIDLASNNIQKITRDFFHGLPDTTHMSLSFNQIGILETDTFFQVPIQKLYLNDNKIRKIESGTFASTTFKALDLGHNLLEQIDGDEFTGLDNLERLNLSRNKISEIKKGFAKHLGKLIELDLSYNPIDRLENGALFGITKAENSIVRLNGIQLDLLQGGVFDDL